MSRITPLLRSALAAGVATFALSAAASAQYVTRRATTSLEEAIAEPPRIAPGVAQLALEHANELALADSQRVLLETIRRSQDSVNRPFAAQLEALRPTHRPANPNDLSKEQVDEIEARRKAIAAIMQSMHDPNAMLRWRAMAVLTPEQQEKAAKLEEDAQQRVDEERTRRARAGYVGEGRRGEDRMSRAQED
ncbi:MAG TPA: Spy/CpxP family protein refolding chaperone [Gemmatimonadaceae bacterium]